MVNCMGWVGFEPIGFPDGSKLLPSPQKPEFSQRNVVPQASFPSLPFYTGHPPPPFHSQLAVVSAGFWNCSDDAVTVTLTKW